MAPLALGEGVAMESGGAMAVRQTSSRGRGVVGLRGLAPLSFSADGGTSEGEGEIERREWRRKGGEQGAG